MKFIKMFFDDEDSKIGLCSFDNLNSKHTTTPNNEVFFFNPFEAQKIFTTDFSRNRMLL